MQLLMEWELSTKSSAGLLLFLIQNYNLLIFKTFKTHRELIQVCFVIS